MGRLARDAHRNKLWPSWPLPFQPKMKLSELQDLLADYVKDGEDPDIEIYDRHGDAIRNPGLHELFGMRGRKEIEKVVFYDIDEH